MSSNTNKRRVKLIAAACVACCVVPLYGIATALTGAGAVALMPWKGALELLYCVLPILVIAGLYFWYRQYKVRESCCSSPQVTCSSAQCTPDITAGLESPTSAPPSHK